MAAVFPVTATARAAVHDSKFGHTVWTEASSSTFAGTGATEKEKEAELPITSMQTSNSSHWHKHVLPFLKTDNGRGLSLWLQTHLNQQQQHDQDDVKNVDQLNPESGLSILHVAVAKGKVSCCEAIMKFGADIRKPSRKGCQAIHLACRHGHVEIIKLLLGESQGLVEGGCKWKQTPASYSLALLSEVTDDGWYPLHEAVWNNKQTTLKFLLPFHTHSDVININVQTRVKLETALMLAVRSLNESVCEQILLANQNGAASLEITNNSGLTAVLIACAIGQASILDLLLSKGTSVTATSHRGATGAHLASRYGHVHVLEKLNHTHPDLFENKTDDGWSCLHEASDTDNSQVANYLLVNTSVDINAQTTTGGNTALHIAAKKGHVTTFCAICDTCATSSCFSTDTLNVGLRNRNKETVLKILENQSPPVLQPEQTTSMKQSLEKVRQKTLELRNQTSTPATVASASVCASRNGTRESSSLQTSFASMSISSQSQKTKSSGGASMDDVFLSYCWAQSVLVEKIHDRLSRKKFKVWMDRFRINPGDRLYDKLQEGVSNCKIFVPCLSAEYLNSDNCRSEFHLAKLWKKPIVPLILDRSLIERWPPTGELAPLLAPLVYLNVIRDNPSYNSSTCHELDAKQLDKLCEKVISLETDKK